MAISLTKTNAKVEADRAQFEEIMLRTQSQAFKLAYRLTGDRAEAEDLTQETYIRAYRFFDRYDPAHSFMGWLYRIMGRIHADRCRKQRKTKAIFPPYDLTEETKEIADISGCPEQALLNQTFDTRIQTGLRAMNPDFRLVLLMADVEGMGYEEIADSMSVSVGTIRSRIHRARKQLKDYLKQFAPGVFDEGVIDEL
ncbi:MAG: sigma-70 family RNA polymerase sigma factor [Armatimonadetes bacterium]|nr:sigma-70 family RNA polymerase sigma factor [Armatimonadota bacterium]